MSQLKNFQSQLARLEASGVNMPASNISVGVAVNPKRASLLRKKTKEKMEDEDESPVTPDSTTEPPKPVHDFHEGDDVFYLNAEGQNILGTVARVTPNSCLVTFGDGTEQWAVFKRLKKLGCSFEEPPAVKKSESAARVLNSEPKNSSKTEKMQVTCSICKCTKEVSERKAASYRGEYKCIKCENKNGTPVANQKGSSVADVHHGTYLGKQNIRRNSLAAAPVKLGSQGKVYVNGEVRRSVPPGIQPGPSKGFSKPIPISHKGFTSKRGSSDVTILDYFQPKPSLEATPPYRPLKSTVGSMYPPRQISNECFHCREVTNYVDRINCKMCERHCHLFCLQLQPAPLNGDRFWDLMCSACGTQNGSEKEARNKVFSVRRNISSWSDVVHLIISCLIAKKGGQHFDLDSQILPFLEKNIDRMHLPRLYKQASKEDRKNNILTALTSSKLRFSKHTGSELKRTNSTLWSLASDYSKDHARDSNKKANPSHITSPIRDAANKVMSSKLLNPAGVKKTRPESLTISATSSSLISKAPSETSLTTITSVPGKSKSPARTSPPSYANTPQVMLSAAKTVLSINRTSAANSPAHAASKLFQSSPKRGLSITPIPTPNQSVSGSYNGYTSDSVSISIAGSPKVLSKEAIMRVPVNTNIVLSPSKGPVTSFASNSFLASIPTVPSCKNDYLSVEKVPNQHPLSASVKSITTENIQVNQVNQAASSDRDVIRGNRDFIRGNLKVRIPLKPTAGTSGLDSDKCSSIKSASELTFPNLTMLPKVPHHGIRSRKRASPEESDDEASSEDSSSTSSFKKIKLTAGNQCSSKASPLKTLVKLEASPMRLAMCRGGRQRLVRTAVLKNKVTQCQKAANALKEKASGRGRGRLSLNKRSLNGSAEPYSESSVAENGKDSDMMNGYGKKGGSGAGKANGNNIGSISRRGRRRKGLSGTGGRLLSEPEDLDPDSQDLKKFNENLLQKIMMGDLRVQCLPRPLCIKNSENAGRRAFYFSEDPHHDFSDNESVLSVGGRSRENSGTESTDDNGYVRRNRFGKTLDDTDSYEVAGTRLNAAGVLEYLLVWKAPIAEGEPDFDDEINRIFFGNSSPLCLKMEPDIVAPEVVNPVLKVENTSDFEAEIETKPPVYEVQTNVAIPSKTAAQSFASNYKVIGNDGKSAPAKVAPVILRSNSLSSNGPRNSLRACAIEMSDSS